ncbi:ovate protein family [Canna indica]|uniref:Ovate protein family n=1 Tax=Canna indica TaxID=4628 RepID=A0AAQ3JP61_9LILI|nr:ovate protein family [Canna indica]
MTERESEGDCSPPEMFGRLRGEDRVEEACRSFENYLVEMIVEEGKVRDLMDVEELLYCWGNLRSPVFVELVSRFYGELCNDLFSADKSGEESEEKMTNVSETMFQVGLRATSTIENIEEIGRMIVDTRISFGR